MHRLITCLLILSCSLGCTLERKPEVIAPETLIGNWLHPRDNTWIYGFFKNFAVADGKFWTYNEIINKDSLTTLKLSRGDTIIRLELSNQSENLLKIKKDGKTSVYTNRHNDNPKYTSYDTVGFKLPLIKKDNFSISGVLNGYDAKKDDFKFATVIYNSLLENDQPNFIADLDSFGRFQVSIPILHPQEVMIKFGSQLIEFYAVPGRSVMVHVYKAQDTGPISSEELVSKISKRADLLFAGDLSRLNTERNDHVFNTWKTVNVKNYYQNLERMNQTDFKQWRQQAKAVQLDDMYKFAKKHNASKSFVQLMRNRIIYACADDLLRYKFDTERKIKLSEQYLSFLSTDLLNSSEAVLTQNYGSFVSQYRQLRLPNGDFPIYLLSDKFLKNGISGDVLMANYVHRMIDYRYPVSAEEQKILLSQIKHPAIRQELAQSLRSYASVEKVEEHTKPSNIERRQQEVLQSLVGKYKGRVVYIDFWGTWCAPCIDEIPASQSLRKKLLNKDIVFLYLAVNSPEHVLKRMIKDKSIIGEHHSLNTGQYELLSNLFQIGGIPHYVIIDKQGKIRNSNARRPTQTKELLVELGKYL